MTMLNPQFETMNDGADFWYYEIGVNVIPCFSQNKNRDAPFSPLSSYKEWFTKELDEQTFNAWKQKGLFENGIAIIGGLVYRGLHKGQYLTMIDLDNQLAINEFCSKGLGVAGEHTLIEQHLDAPDRAHIYFYTTKPLKKKVLSTQEENSTDKPKIEVKGDGGHGVHIVAPSLHKNGARYEIVSSVTAPYATNENLQEKINAICAKYGIPYSNNDDSGLVPTSTLMSDDYRVYAGENRHGEVMRYMESKRIRNPEFSDDMILALAKDWNKKHCMPPLDDNDPVWTREFSSAKKFSLEKIKEREQEKSADTTAKEGQRISKSKDIIDSTAAQIKSKYDFVTEAETDDISLYDGKIYNRAKAEALIIREAEEIIENCTTHDRNEVLNKIKAQTHIDLEDFDKDPNLVTLDNGILDLANLELRPHTPEHLSRVLLPVEFERPQFEIREESIFEDIEKNLENTLFWQFLKRSFTVDNEFREKDFQTVLEIMASPIVKRQIDEKAFIFLGPGENGKSVALDYIRLLYGDSNVSRVTLQALADDKFMAAELVGKSANIFTDLEAGEMKHTGKVKAITSGEGLQAQEKYHKPFTLKPFAKLMFSCNRFPKIYDQSQGFFRRWVIVKWERNFEKDPERDPLLREKLRENTEERKLVFSCLVYLARRLNKTGKFTHSKDWKATQREWNENADPVDYFVTNYVIDSPHHRSIRDTYSHYKQVMLMKGEVPLGVGQFGKVFAEYFEQWINKDKETGKTERVWLNIDLKPIEIGDYST